MEDGVDLLDDDQLLAVAVALVSLLG